MGVFVPLSINHNPMIAATHFVFATGLYLGGSALFEYPVESIGWGLAVFFSLVPDIDLPTSRIGRPLFWLSVRLERQYCHRTVTHSLVALLFLTGVASPLFAVGRSGRYWAILGGYWSYLWLDMPTLRGIDLFWPSTVRVWSCRAPRPTGWTSSARPRGSCCRPWCCWPWPCDGQRNGPSEERGMRDLVAPIILNSASPHLDFFPLRCHAPCASAYSSVPQQHTGMWWSYRTARDASLAKLAAKPTVPILNSDRHVLSWDGDLCRSKIETHNAVDFYRVHGQ